MRHKIWVIPWKNDPCIITLRNICHWWCPSCCKQFYLESINCTSLARVWDFLWRSYVVWWVSSVGGVLDGPLGWWGIWWGLVGVGLVLEFPWLGACVCGACGLGCLELLWGFPPWTVPLTFGLAPKSGGLEDFGLLSVLWPCGAEFLVCGGGGADKGLISSGLFARFLYLPSGLLCISLLWLLHCIVWDSLAGFHIFARGLYFKTHFSCYPLKFFCFFFYFYNFILGVLLTYLFIFF